MNTKDKTTAALLCFFLGGISAHRFYVGKVGTAFGQAALPVVGLIVLISAVTATPTVDAAGVIGMLMLMGGALWILVDFVRILMGRFTDAHGDILGAAKRTAPSPDPSLTGQRIQQRILMIAKQQGGVVGPTDIAMRTGIAIDEAKEHLESLLDKGHVEMHLRKDGGLVYVFSDMLTEERRSELDQL